jgi:hypothetical protein
MPASMETECCGACCTSEDRLMVSHHMKFYRICSKILRTSTDCCIQSLTLSGFPDDDHMLLVNLFPILLRSCLSSCIVTALCEYTRQLLFVPGGISAHASTHCSSGLPSPGGTMHCSRVHIHYYA